MLSAVAQRRDRSPIVLLPVGLYPVGRLMRAGRRIAFVFDVGVKPLLSNRRVGSEFSDRWKRVEKVLDRRKLVLFNIVVFRERGVRALTGPRLICRHELEKSFDRRKR